MSAEDRRAQRRARAARERRRRTRRTLTFGGVLALLITVFFGAALATDTSSLCASCHEMTPYTAAWSAGPHATDAECVDCHVDPGIASRLAHKPAVLGELFAHFQGDTSFPRPERPDVPDVRCVQCHEDVGSTDAAPGFSHPDHVERAACQDCHVGVGHAVTQADLEDAGVFDTDAAQARVVGIPGDAVAAPDSGSANVSGHAVITCTRCHDLARTGCSGCHAVAVPETHPAGDECAACHPSVDSWAFSHPDSESCADCHEQPDIQDHPERDDCGTCHSTTGEWRHDR